MAKSVRLLYKNGEVVRDVDIPDYSLPPDIVLLGSRAYRFLNAVQSPRIYVEATVAAAITGLENMPEPELRSTWRHTNGNLYRVLLITNLFDEVRYPKTVVYQGTNGNVWSRPLSDWHRSMTEVKAP